MLNGYECSKSARVRAISAPALPTLPSPVLSYPSFVGLRLICTYVAPFDKESDLRGRKSARFINICGSALDTIGPIFTARYTQTINRHVEMNL